MIRWNVFFEVEKVEQLALIYRLATHHDRPPSLKAQENGIMIRRYQRGLFQQDRPKADMSGRFCCGRVPKTMRVPPWRRTVAATWPTPRSFPVIVLAATAILLAGLYITYRLVDPLP